MLRLSRCQIGYGMVMFPHLDGQPGSVMDVAARIVNENMTAVVNQSHERRQKIDMICSIII